MLAKNRKGYALFVLPALLLFSVIIVIPFLRGLVVSFSDWDGLSPSFNWVGFENYQKIFATDTALGPVKNSLIFTLITLVMDNFIGLTLAMLLHKSIRGRSLLRVIFFMPFIISLVVSSYMWTYLYSSVLYPLFGLTNPLGDPATSNLGVALISVWRNSGYCMLIYLAGLSAIPESLYEAAVVEGAGQFRRFRDITLPLLVPSFSVNITLILAWGLKEFDTVMVATGGGPGRSSMSMAFYVYKTTFVWNKAGYGQAIAVMMMLLIVAISTAVARFLRSKEVEL